MIQETPDSGSGSAAATLSDVLLILAPQSRSALPSHRFLSQHWESNASSSGLAPTAPLSGHTIKLHHELGAKLTEDEGVRLFSQRHMKVMTCEVISVCMCMCVMNNLQANFTLGIEWTKQVVSVMDFFFIIL